MSLFDALLGRTSLLTLSENSARKQCAYISPTGVELWFQQPVIFNLCASCSNKTNKWPSPKLHLALYKYFSLAHCNLPHHKVL